MADKGQVAASDAKTGDIASPTVHDRFSEYMQLRAKQDERDTGTADEAMNRISEKLLTAETEADIWDADEGSLPSAEDMVDIEQRIFGFDIVASKDEDKRNKRTGNAYLVVHAARLDNGEMVDWSTSSTLVVQKLIRFSQLSPNPYFLDGKYLDAVVRSNTTNAGNEVYKLRPIPQRAI
jgi:hypothetical protein